MKTLQVTSPFITGSDVKAAQRAMKENPFGTFYRGDVDGEFGPLSASASKDAKFWLGYESMNVKQGYGEPLHDLLTGDGDLPGAMGKRRASRLARPPEKMLRQKRVEIAVSQLGLEESPSGSNRVKFSGWYGMVGPWCAMFDTWCGVQAGMTAYDRGDRWAYCPYMVADAVEGRNGLRARGRSEAPQPGDSVLYHFGNADRVARHVGVFEKGSRGSFTAIEGNTSVSSDDNGGKVMRRERGEGSVRLFAYAVR